MSGRAVMDCTDIIEKLINLGYTYDESKNVYLIHKNTNQLDSLIEFILTKEALKEEYKRLDNNFI